MDLSALFAPSLLIFTVPLCLSMALGALAVVGLFDIEALDFDADLDLDADVDLDADLGLDADADLDGASGGGGVLSVLGVGLIPASLMLVIVSFCFGWIGLVLMSWVGEAVARLVGSAMAASAVLTVPALVSAFGVAAPLARLLHPLFRDYGQAKGAHELVGSVAVLTTGSLSASFGSAALTLPERGRIEVSVRAQHPEDAADLDYGDRILLYDYDPEKKIYFAAKYEEE